MAQTEHRDDRTRAALGALSIVGAAIAGFGVGVLFARVRAPLAWPAVIVGVVAHLVGMIGTMQLQSAHGYMPSMMERAGYWLCWSIIGALLIYAGVEVVR